MVENDHFRALLCFLTKGIGSLLHHTSLTIRCWVVEEYENHKKSLVKELHEASKQHTPLIRPLGLAELLRDH